MNEDSDAGRDKWQSSDRSTSPDAGVETPPASKIELIAGSGNSLAASLLQALRQATNPDRVSLRSPEDSVSAHANFVYLPSAANRDGMTPDLAEAHRIFQQYGRARGNRFILLSSALIYGTGPSRLSMVGETYVAPRDGKESVWRAWRSLEAAANDSLEEKSLVVLRAATVLPSHSVLSRRLMRRLTITLPGRNPMVQILSPADLTQAVLRAVESHRCGVFNVAPDGAVPLHAAIRIAGSYRIPVPGIVQRLIRKRETLDYLRYPWTVSNHAGKEQLGFAPTKSSVTTLLEHRGQGKVVVERAFDEFGMDPEYIRFWSKTLFRFLCDVYWRIEARGTEHIPRDGRAVLVGTHRGFMPWDGVMALHLVVKETGRFPRFLTHPGLFKFPFISSLMTRLGGVIACQESAARVLEAGEVLGVYPEGVRGAFALHRNAYQIQPSWQNTFVKLALRHRAPIVPFVNVGSADSLPVFAQIKSRFWTRYADWPCIPVSTFPFLPLPLPSKWHVEFLPAIHVEQQYPPESAEDAALVKKIGLEVKGRMQETMERIARGRRSVFF